MEILLLAGLAALFTFLGGSLPLLKKELKANHLSWLIALSAGILLSTGLNHMVAESIEEAGRESIVAISIGFVLLFLMARFAMVHACGEEECPTHTFSGIALAGMGFHSFLDGFAIAVSMESSLSLGYIVVLGVLMHRLPTGISIATILLANRYNRENAFILLTLIGLTAVVGALFGSLIPFESARLLGMGVGFSAGVFIYIATADLLPMVHVKKGDYISPLSFVTGFLGVMFY
jgi:zinc transporter ZupT